MAMVPSCVIYSVPSLVYRHLVVNQRRCSNRSVLAVHLSLMPFSSPQTWKNNMGSAGKVSITDSTQDYTKVTFKPDLAKFKMTHLTADMVSLMTRRAYDMAGCTKGVSVYFNGKKLPVSMAMSLAPHLTSSCADQDVQGLCSTVPKGPGRRSRGRGRAS